jgi:two-component sensor histidine kinase
LSSTREKPDSASSPVAAAGEGAARHGFRQVSVGAILSLLMAAMIVPALIFAVVLLQRNNQAQQTMVTTLAETAAGSIAETVDRQLNGMFTTLRVLATSHALERDDLADFYRRAAVALDGSGTHLIVTDGSLNQLINTRVPFGTQLGRITNTEAAGQAIATGNGTVSGAFYGETAQQWVFNVVLPLPYETGRARLLILTQDAETLSSTLASQNLRGGWNVVLTDRKGIILATSYLSSDIGSTFFLASGIEPSSSTVRSRTRFEGVDYETIRARSALSGWETVVWAPSDVVQAPMLRSLRYLALGGLTIIAIGSTLAWVLGRQIARPIRQLARDARRLGAGEDVVAVDFPVTEIRTVSHALAQASRDRQASENEIRFLMREVAHRSKNQLTVVSSIAKQTARYARTLAGFQDSFQKRVQGLARSTDLLVAGGVAGVELRELLMAQIEPFRPSDASRLEIEGPQFRLSNQAAQTIGLALHELATNAAKYGAFATPDGRLAVNWHRTGDTLNMVWREYVPRLRRRAEGRGFGTEVIERMLGGTLDARIDRVLHGDGLECKVAMPVEKLEPDHADADESGLPA